MLIPFIRMGGKTPPEYAHTVDLYARNAIYYLGVPNTVTIIVLIIPGFCLVPSSDS